jgi:RNA polymerase sigma factor (sigma-70 family)
MPLADDEFAALLARARQGDQAALGDIARQYEPQLRLVARVLLGPALRPYLDTLDLVQSVHKSLLLGLRHDRFDVSTPENLVALALTMVRRKAARHWRHLQRQQRLEGQHAPDSDAAHPLNTLPSPEPDPTHTAEQNDLLAYAFRYLDQWEQHIVALRLQGYSQLEIARQLGVDPDVFRSYWSRASQRLRASGVLKEWL